MFDENTLKEEIKKQWGEAGAHMDVFTEMQKRERKQKELLDHIQEKLSYCLKCCRPMLIIKQLVEKLKQENK